MKKSETARYHVRSKVLLNIDEKHEVCINITRYVNIKTGSYDLRPRGEPYLIYRDTGYEDKLMRGIDNILLYLKDHVSIDEYFKVEKFFMERHT